MTDTHETVPPMSAEQHAWYAYRRSQGTSEGRLDSWLAGSMAFHAGWEARSAVHSAVDGSRRSAEATEVMETARAFLTEEGAAFSEMALVAVGAAYDTGWDARGSSIVEDALRHVPRGVACPLPSAACPLCEVRDGLRTIGLAP